MITVTARCPPRMALTQPQMRINTKFLVIAFRIIDGFASISPGKRITTVATSSLTMKKGKEGREGCGRGVKEIVWGSLDQLVLDSFNSRSMTTVTRPPFKNISQGAWAPLTLQSLTLDNFTGHWSRIRPVRDLFVKNQFVSGHWDQETRKREESQVKSVEKRSKSQKSAASKQQTRFLQFY